MATCSVLLYKIKFDQDYPIDEIVNTLENDVMDETRVVVEDYDDRSLSGIYIYSEMYKSQEYNFQTNTFEVVSRKKYVATEIHINVMEKYMDIWGNAKNAQRVISAVSMLFDNRVTIDAMEMKFARMVEFLSKEDNVYVGKVTARQVALGDGLLADCSFDLSFQDKPFETIEKYKNNIQKIGFKWKCVNSNIRMFIYMSGAVTVYKERHLIDDDELECIYKMLLYAGR